jgi:hypothetical protein
MHNNTGMGHSIAPNVSYQIVWGLGTQKLSEAKLPCSPPGGAAQCCSHPRLFDSDSQLQEQDKGTGIGLEQPLLFLIVAEDEPSKLHFVLII